MTCLHCGQPFGGRRRKFCAPACRRANTLAGVRSAYSLGSRFAVSRHALGAFSQLRVAADLVSQGWQVFFPAAGDSPFDIAAWKNGQFIGVEVKSGRILPNGREIYPEPSAREREAMTHLAVALPNDTIGYVPALPEV